jgi:hypothetical protein
MSVKALDVSILFVCVIWQCRSDQKTSVTAPADHSDCSDARHTWLHCPVFLGVYELHGRPSWALYQKPMWDLASLGRTL